LLARRKAVNMDVRYVRPAGRYCAACTSLHVSERNSLARIVLRRAASAAANVVIVGLAGWYYQDGDLSQLVISINIDCYFYFTTLLPSRADNQTRDEPVV